MFLHEAIIGSIKRGAEMTNAGNKFKYYPSETTDPNNRQASIPGLPTTANPIQHFPILYRPSGAIVYDGTNAGDVPVFWGPKERCHYSQVPKPLDSLWYCQTPEPKIHYSLESLYELHWRWSDLNIEKQGLVDPYHG